MKTFAHWKNITINTSTPLEPAVSSDHVRGVGQDEVAAHFIVNIPEETAPEDVIAKSAGKLLASGELIEETDGFGFEEEWPQGIRRQFDSGAATTWSWLSLK
jgi:hypothetical protein